MAKASPKGGKRGCLCPDGKSYSSECCTGELQAQGIGASEGGQVSVIINTNETVTNTYERH